MSIAGRNRKRARTSLSDDIPVAVVPAFNNPTLTQNTLNHISHHANLDEEFSKFETPDLFATVLNEDMQHPMNSSEFQDFIRTLSYSSECLALN